jgi:hypothetical protein
VEADQLAQLKPPAASCFKVRLRLVDIYSRQRSNKVEQLTANANKPAAQAPIRQPSARDLSADRQLGCAEQLRGAANVQKFARQATRAGAPARFSLRWFARHD